MSHLSAGVEEVGVQASHHARLDGVVDEVVPAETAQHAWIAVPLAWGPAPVLVAAQIDEGSGTCLV